MAIGRQLNEGVLRTNLLGIRLDFKNSPYPLEWQSRQLAVLCLSLPSEHNCE